MDSERKLLLDFLATFDELIASSKDGIRDSPDEQSAQFWASHLESMEAKREKIVAILVERGWEH